MPSYTDATRGPRILTDIRREGATGLDKVVDGPAVDGPAVGPAVGLKGHFRRCLVFPLLCPVQSQPGYPHGKIFAVV